MEDFTSAESYRITGPKYCTWKDSPINNRKVRQKSLRFVLILLFCSLFKVYRLYAGQMSKNVILSTFREIIGKCHSNIFFTIKKSIFYFLKLFSNWNFDLFSCAEERNFRYRGQESRSRSWWMSASSPSPRSTPLVSRKHRRSHENYTLINLMPLSD
jgi:hypothetical protein